MRDYPSSENKGADQLRDWSVPLFSHMQIVGFLSSGSLLLSVVFGDNQKVTFLKFFNKKYYYIAINIK